MLRLNKFDHAELSRQDGPLMKDLCKLPDMFAVVCSVPDVATPTIGWGD